MNTVLVRLFVAFACFALSVSLTSFTRLFHGAACPADGSALEAPISNVNFSHDENQIREIYRQYGPAQTRHDRAFFERIETEDFRLFFDDKSISRDEDIRWMESSSTDIVYHNQPLDIKIYGNSAVAHTHFEVRYSDGHVNRWDTIDIWVKRGNDWQIRSTTSRY